MFSFVPISISYSSERTRTPSSYVRLYHFLEMQSIFQITFTESFQQKPLYCAGTLVNPAKGKNITVNSILLHQEDKKVSSKLSCNFLCKKTGKLST